MSGPVIMRRSGLQVLALAVAAGQVLRNGLALLKITAPEQM